MAFQLIPMPISLLFVVIFVIAVTFILWKMRRRSKFFRFLFYFVTVIALIMFAAMVWMSVFPNPTMPTGPIPTQTSPGPGPVDVTLTTNKATYVFGEAVQVKVQVFNPNDWTVAAPQEIKYQITNDHGLNRIVREVNFQSGLAPNSEKNFRLKEENCFSQPGNYTISVTIWDNLDYSQVKQVNITINPA